LLTISISHTESLTGFSAWVSRRCMWTAKDSLWGN